MKYLSNKLICIHEAYCLRMSLVVESIIRKKVIHGWLHLRLGYANDIWTSLSTDLSQHSGRSKMCPILKILSTGVSQGNTLIGISHSCLTLHLSLRPTFAWKNAPSPCVAVWENKQTNKQKRTEITNCQWQICLCRRVLQSLLQLHSNKRDVSRASWTLRPTANAIRT